MMEAIIRGAWVMRPNMDTVNTAKELIRQVMSGETPQVP